jgi:hypothetical protein
MIDEKETCSYLAAYRFSKGKISTVVDTEDKES